MKDLFEQLETLPTKVKEIIENFESGSFIECEKLEKQLNNLGYTFNYSLDAEPYNLQNLNK